MQPYLMPHSVCWASAPGLIWTMVVTNLITFLSYLTICGTLLFLVRRTRKVIVRDWAYFVVGFALFILACGSTHLLEVITTWNPIFWVDAWTNIVTAILSAYVATMLIGRVKNISFGINDYAERLTNTESEKLRMQERLLAAQKLEDWSRMSAAVSHEIKGPLQAIQNLQYLIGTSEDVSPQIAELARLSGEEAERALAISVATLSYFRQGTQLELTDLSSEADSVRILLAPLIRKKGIDFRIEHRGDCSVKASPGEPRQVLLNLIRNACEAITGRDTRVTVEILGAEAGVEVVVTDQGSGIDPEILPTLFNFGSTTKGMGGNGMGLWTVKHILNKHQGDVKIQSTRNEGTRVQLWWPRTPFTFPGQNVPQ